jgi:hypothetical protein
MPPEQQQAMAGNRATLAVYAGAGSGSMLDPTLSDRPARYRYRRSYCGVTATRSSIPTTAVPLPQPSRQHDSRCSPTRAEWQYESVVLDAETMSANAELPLVVRLSNSGSRAGREVVQVYLEAPDADSSRPIRILAGFATVDADGGESVEARVVIPARAFARFDPDTRDWVWRSGTYTVRAGRSSRDLRLSATVQLEGTPPTA